MRYLGSFVLLAALWGFIDGQKECEEVMDLALVVDQSDSFSRPGDFDKLKDFLGEIGKNFPIKPNGPSRLGLVTYSEQANLVKDLDDCPDTKCFLDAIGAIRPAGFSVNINAGLQMAMDRVLTPSGGDRPGVQDVLVLITDDGVPEGQVVDPALMKRIRDRGVRVVVVGIEKKADDDKLFDLASQPFYDNVFFIGKMRDPSDGASGSAIADIGEGFCELLCIPDPRGQGPTTDVIMPEDCLYDIAFLVDTSGSITGVPAFTDNWIQMRQFLRSFIRQMKIDFPNVHIAMMHFRTRANMVFSFADADNNTDISIMDGLIRDLPYPWGSTAMKTAFEQFAAQIIEGPGNRPKVPDLVIFMTDGFPNPFLEQDPRQAAARLRSMGVRIYGIGVTSNVNEDVMRTIVSPPSVQNFAPALTYRELASSAMQILADTCMVPGEPCRLKQDVIILLDVASKDQDVIMQKRIVSTLADRLDFSQARIALVTFSNEPKLQFNLDNCTDAGCVRRILSALDLAAGESHVEGAFDVALRQVLGSAGDRPDAQNTIVLITDGYPDTSLADRLPSIEAAKNVARVFVIAVSEGADKKPIFDLASTPTVENVFFSYKYSDILGLFNQVGEKFCPVKQIPTPVPPPGKCEKDIVILVDLSKSVIDTGARGQNFIELRDFLQNLVKKIKSTYPVANIALAHFSDGSTISWTFEEASGNRDVQTMIDMIRKLPKPSGEPGLSAAFERIKEIFRKPSNRANMPDAVLVITDGLPESNPAELKRIATELKEKLDIEIVGLGITDKVQKELFKDISSVPEEHYTLYVKSYLALHHHVDDAIAKVCEGRPEPTPPPLPCAMADNVVFLLDSSGSMRHEDFENMKEFVKQSMPILPREGRKVALVQFATAVQTIFTFRQSEVDQKETMNIIDAMKHTRGKTNTDMALAHISDRILANVQGGKNIVVLFTDGDSSNAKATVREAIRLKKKAHLIVVQIGSWLRQQEINAIASYPHEKNVIKLRKFRELSLENIKEKIYNRICNNNDTCPATLCQNGGVVQNVHGECMCDCQSGFVQQKCDKRCSEPVDLMLVVDKSGSIQPSDFDRQIEFMQKVVLAMNFRQQRLGLVSFSDEAEVNLRLGDVVDKVQALEGMQLHHTRGGTNTHRALEATRLAFQGVSRMHSGKPVPKLAVLMTDGKSQDPEKTFEEAMKLQESGVHVIAVGIGRGIRQKELDAIASDPGKVFNLDSYKELEDQLLKPLFQKLCDNPCAGIACQNGGLPEVVLDKCVCRCPPGYSGPGCERACSAKIDLGLLVDASGSIRNERFPYVLRFLSEVVGNLTVGPNDAYIGAVSWSSSAKLEFGMNQYKNAHEVVSAIKMISFQGQLTNTFNALNIARQQLFSPAVSRPEAPDFILLVTDGGSNINTRQTIPEAVQLKQQGVHITVAAVGDDMDPYELKALASDPVDENLIWAPNQVELLSLVQKTYMSVCNDVDECNSNPCQNGGTCQDGMKMYLCLCPYGIIGSNCQGTCNKQLDIVLLTDVSGSVEHVHDIIAAIAKKFVQHINVDSGAHRVALISFSDEVSVHFPLGTHKTKKELLDAVAVVKKAGGKTNTALGLSVSYIDLFRSERGDRPEADNILVVVTDANSNVNTANTQSEARAAKERGVKVIPVMTGNMNMQEAENMASDPTGGIVVVRDKTDIDKAIEKLVDIMCTGFAPISPPVDEPVNPSMP